KDSATCFRSRRSTNQGLGVHYLAAPRRDASRKHVMAHCDESLSEIGEGSLVGCPPEMKSMINHLVLIAGASLFALPGLMAAIGRSRQTEADRCAGANGPGPYAQIGFLRPRDGNTVDFEAGYTRHLEWHRPGNTPFGTVGGGL